jgi:dipeptidyl aminopeptidase/acylaminoacyl peptidase
MKDVRRVLMIRIGLLSGLILAYRLTIGIPAIAQEQQKYMMPPMAIAQLADAPTTPGVSVSPDNAWLLLMYRPGLPPIEEVAQPELRIAGLRINPRTNGPSRGNYYNALSLKKFPDGAEQPITGLPEDPQISNVGWAPDGRTIAFTLTFADHLELWVAQLNNCTARRLSALPINDAYGNCYEWFSDSQTLLIFTIVAGRGPVATEPLAPAGPVIQENLGRKTPAQTYQDLLKNAYDEAVFEYYATSQLALLTLEGKLTPLGNPGIISAESSPDGKYILVERIHRPFSYSVPYHRFPHTIEVWDQTGNIAYTVAEVPLADNIPITFGSVRTGRRDVSWRADAPATLCWVEALDGGDAGVEADERDRVFMLPAPFAGEPAALITLKTRYSNILWGNDDLALVTESWWKTRNYKITAFAPGSPAAEPMVLIDQSWEDRYNDPGTPLLRPTEWGTWVLLTADNGNTLFLSGDGASPEGDRPFLDGYNLQTHETTRLFHSEAPSYERPVRLIDVDNRKLLTSRESVSEPPNYYLRELNQNQSTAVTSFPHPTPQLAQVQKELIRYKRADSVDLTATLYLPAGYSPADGPLPMLMWAYPQEYKDADFAGQVTDSPYRFVRISAHSPLFWLVHGYAILDDPTMPIIGEGEEEPNDSYVKQLVASAQAAVDEVVRRGVADPDKIAVGGHSYGAFMAANLLAHSDLFRLGIARSGAYNRSLTPFGFQSEERTFWEAPEVYFAMSPFMHADKINEPILLIHGEADNNSGTFPLQSERFYGALKGLGATARLVLLPHESHGYRARESVMHILYEMTDWLDRYVKNAGPREQPQSETNPEGR